MTRLKNLEELIEQMFDGNASAAAKALSRSHTFMWQLLNRQRSIGENTARYIEEKFDRTPGSLDTPDVMEPTTVLKVNVSGGVTRNYMMVPMVELQNIRRKPKAGAELMPCPVEGASEETVTFRQTDESMEPDVRVGEWVYADPKQKELIAKALFVINVNGTELVRRTRRWEGRWQFVGPSHDGARRVAPIEEKDAKVYGKVVGIWRDPSAL